MPRPLALVTGASSGIGAELARELARDGHDLILAARSLEPMQTLAAELLPLGAKTTILQTDLSLPHAAAQLTSEIESLGLAVDVLINNAGLGEGAAFLESDPARNQAILQVNIVALTELTRLLLPGMVARGKGRILLVGSTAGFQPGPYMAVYSATKAYVLSFGEAIRYELRHSGVTVTVLCPGATATNFAHTAAMNESKLFSFTPVMTSAEVARSGYRALREGQSVVITGLVNKILGFSGRLMPRAISLPIAAFLMGGKS